MNGTIAGLLTAILIVASASGTTTSKSVEGHIIGDGTWMEIIPTNHTITSCESEKLNCTFSNMSALLTYQPSFSVLPMWVSENVTLLESNNDVTVVSARLIVVPYAFFIVILLIIAGIYVAVTYKKEFAISWS